MHKYIEAIKQNIEKLMEMEPTPERAQYMHDLLYVKKHMMMKHGDTSAVEHYENPNKSYFGGGM